MRIFLIIGFIIIILISVFLYLTNTPKKELQNTINQNLISNIKSVKNSYEKIDYITKDGVKIVGNFYKIDSPKLYALLIHMMPATKESYNNFAMFLKDKDISSLAIDLRGHGKSTLQNENTINFNDFSDKSHQDSIADIKSGIDFLKNNGAQPNQIFIVGASIGANLALWYLKEHSDIKGTVLLSPGIDYKGIKTAPLMTGLSKNQKVFLVASKEDPESYTAITTLNNLNGKSSDILKLEMGGHGTDMLENYAELENKIYSWIKSLYNI